MSRNELHEGQEGRLLLWAADWLTVLLLAVGVIFPCLSAYVISSQRGFDFGAVIAFCVFGSLAVTAMFTWKHGYWAALAVLAAGGLAFWRLWVNFAEGWRRIRDPVLADLFTEWPGTLYLQYALAVLLLGWTVVRVRAWWLAAALVVLPLLPAFQAGVLPAWGAMLAGFAGWGSMLLTGLFGKKDRASLARARFLSLGGMAALLLILVMCLPMEGYTRPQWATNARKDLILTVNRQLERFFAPEDLENNLLTQLGLDLTVDGGGSGTQGSGQPNAIEVTESGQRENLLRLGPRTYSERRVMSVSTDQPDPAGRVYLRGVSFDFYTGTSWENLFQSGIQPGLFPGMTAGDVPEYTMTIRNTAFRGVWYYPYRFTGGGEMNEAGQITVLEGGADDSGQLPMEAMGLPSREEYKITYRPGGPEAGLVPLSGSAAVEEEAYRSGEGRAAEGVDIEGSIVTYGDTWTAVETRRDFLTSYLAVPDGVDAVLAPLVEEIRQVDAAVDIRLPAQFREAVAAAARTAGFLASAAVYDPDTPAMDPAGDFVTHFLTEGRGYCVHFATAGALLLRMQGIPARYVSGYVADLDGQGRATVLDRDAHAWVEIYLDGYGWYPVEMTPGYSGGVSGVELEGGTAAPVGGEGPEEDEPEEAPPEEEQPEEEVPEDAPDEEAPVEGPAEEDAAGNPVLSVIWKWLFGVAVFWAILCAAYLAALFLRRRDREDTDTNRSVLNAYGRYKRLRHWGCGEDEELERLAKKAKFSQHTLTEEERKSGWKCLDEDVKQSRVGQPVRRRWLFALLCPIF